MRILYIATAYPRSEQDIITPWLVETVVRLRKRGFDVTMFTSSYRGLGNQIISGVPVIRFRYFFKRWETLTHDETAVDRVKRGLGYKLMAIFYVLFGTWAIWRLCRSQRFDIIHVHWPLPHAVFGYLAARICKAPIVISFHGVTLMWVRRELRIMKPFLCWTIRKADAITANSTHTAKAIQQIVDRPVSIVPFGAAVGQFPSTAPVTKGKEKQLLFIGRLVERKGIPYLIEAVEILSRELPVKLNIIGYGPDEPMLRELIRQKGLGRTVIMHGKVTPQQLHDHYLNCDVFVLPAVVDAKGDTEGLGVVLIEAMSYHKPVVASGVGGIVDLVIHNKTGLRTPPGDSRALAAAIRSILTDPELAQRLAEGGYQHVKADYSWPRIISRLEDIYHRLLGTRHQAGPSSASQ